MKMTLWIAPAMAAAMLLGGLAAEGQYYGGQPQPAYRQYPGNGGPGNGGPAWDAPPPEFRAAQQRGFHDGVEGARKDYAHHRQPDVNNRNEYRNPKFIPAPDRRDYVEGFRQGYYAAVRHMYGPGRY